MEKMKDQKLIKAKKLIEENRKFFGTDQSSFLDKTIFELIVI